MGTEDIYHLIIIGGGPAGITAGIYSARQRLRTLLITKGFGGQMARKAVMIENYSGFKEISGQELIQKMTSHLKKFEIDPHHQNFGVGVEIKQTEVIKVKKEKDVFSVFTKENEEFRSHALIVASGADPRPLEVAGEKEFLGRGVSYCVACDAPLFKNKNVVVIGGGDAGFEAALALSSFGKKIYILEYAPIVKASPENQEKAKETGKIEIITSAAMKEIKGDRFVGSIVYEDQITKKEKKLEVNGVFIEIGSHPATAFVRDLVKFDHLLNKLDEIEINPRTCETSTSGLFAAGDVSDVLYKQIVIAAGEGAKAALSAYRYLNEKGLLV